jgi:prophage regulatory protein
MSAERMLSWPAVHSRTGLGRTTVFREIKAGRFPASVKISKGRVGWRESDIDAWIEAREAEQGGRGQDRDRARDENGGMNHAPSVQTKPQPWRGLRRVV